MTVLEIEKTKESKTIKTEKDTWILELPAEVCQREGFAEGTMVSLTIRDGGIKTSIIRPSVEIENFVSRIIEEEKEFFEEMKRIGD
jgi:hypothetical protein